jgi:hypothetical protein
MPVVAIILYHVLALFVLYLVRDVAPASVFALALAVLVLGSAGLVQAVRTQAMRRPRLI